MTLSQYFQLNATEARIKKDITQFEISLTKMYFFLMQNTTSCHNDNI